MWWCEPYIKMTNIDIEFQCDIKPKRKYIGLSDIILKTGKHSEPVHSAPSFLLSTNCWPSFTFHHSRCYIIYPILMLRALSLSVWVTSCDAAFLTLHTHEGTCDRVSLADFRRYPYWLMFKCQSHIWSGKKRSMSTALRQTQVTLTDKQCWFTIFFFVLFSKMAHCQNVTS